ncbi:MAG: MATE family efflux transporter [Treponemataceae bacterium]|nr:MATE family efflux transporter [Treponemataceae bacterium]
MGTMGINKLLISMSLPMMISMLVQALYNIVDSIFVARVCEDAFTAVSLVFPVQTLVVALVGGTGIGVGTVLSHALGEKKFDKVNKVAITGIILTSIYFLVFVMIGIFVSGPFFRSQTDNQAIIKYGIDYMTVIQCASLGICTQFIFERLLISTGKSFYSMITQMTGAIINICLDPIFIFGLNIKGVQLVPRLEAQGAAIATVIGQTIAGTLAFIFNLKFNKEISYNVKHFRIEGCILAQIYKIGIPTIIMQAIGSVMVFGFNKILMVFTSTAVAVFGAYFKLQSFFFMPVFGLNNGMVPIIAYNYGAQKKYRITKTIKFAVLYAMIIMFLGFLAFELLPGQLLKIFKASDNMMAMGVPALRIIAVHFLICGFCIIAGSACQALGKAYYSMIISIARQLVVLLPVAYLLSLTGNVNLIWWSFPIAEMVSMILSAIFLANTYKKIIKPIHD